MTYATHHRYTPEFVERFLKRLEGTEGKISVAANSLGIAGATISIWRFRHPEFDLECKRVIEKVAEEGR